MHIILIVLKKSIKDYEKKIKTKNVFSLHQEMVYKVLGCWIRISRGAVHTHFQMQIIKCILKDITPLKNSISLSVST